MKIKKIIALGLAVSLMCTFAGCNTSKKKAAEATTEAAVTEYKPIEIDAKEYVELGEYKGIKIKGASIKVTEAQIQEDIDNLSAEYMTYVPIKDRNVVKDQDFVNIDYTCTVDGKILKDYSDTDSDIQIGSGELTVGDVFDMEKELIGVKVGETKKMSFKAPEDYGDEQIDGKECTVDVTVNAIQKEEYPKIDDAFIKKNTEYKSLKAYKDSVRKELEATAKEDADAANEEKLWETVVENCKQIKPFSDELLKQSKNNALAQATEYAAWFNMDVEEFLKEYYKQTLEEFAESSLKDQCIQQLLIEKEGITVSDAEVDKAIEKEMKENGYESKEEFLQGYSEDDFREQIIYDKMMNMIKSNAKIQ